MKHRTLLGCPYTDADLRDLLLTLPVYLDEIVLARPALSTEVETIQQFVARLRQHVAAANLVDKQTILERLHQALTPLFAG